MTCCAFVTLGRGRDSSCDPLRRTECQNTVVAQEESTKFGVGSLFLVAKDCSKVKRTYNSGGRWTEYLPSLEGIQEDFRIRGQRSKGRGGVSVTQLFLKTERKKRSWMVMLSPIRCIPLKRFSGWWSGTNVQSYLRHQTTYVLTDPQIDVNEAIYVKKI